MKSHIFQGQWITTEEFATLAPRNVFFRQLDRVRLDTSEHRDRHILFRATVELGDFSTAKICISADDVYKLYINGTFVGQGPRRPTISAITITRSTSRRISNRARTPSPSIPFTKALSTASGRAATTATV